MKKTAARDTWREIELSVRTIAEKVIPDIGGNEAARRKDDVVAP
jgi:hypothetical protein